jgi:ribosomal protein S18 acetylase RimI-like enzyme
MELQVTPFQDSYRDAVVDLWYQVGLVSAHNDPSIDIEHKVRYQPELFFVGLAGGRVVATVMAGHEGHRGLLSYLAVVPECQGLGMGRHMLEHAERALSELGCMKVNLQVRDSNLGVVGFY